jgi:hypothetical protein
MQPDNEKRPANGGVGRASGTFSSRAAEQGLITRTVRRGPASPRLKVAFEADGRMREVQGQCARALMALVAAGPEGVTAQEVASWSFRLAAYVHDLRRKHGLVVVTEREPHPGGWHGRHILLTPVRIHSVDG